MISLPRITRLAAAHRFDTLLDDVLRNGRPLPLALRLRLASDPEALPGVALALALRRFLELTLGPTPQALDLARALLDRQRPGATAAEAAATAAALSTLVEAFGWHGSPEPCMGDTGWHGSPEPCIGDVLARSRAAVRDSLDALRATRDASPTTLRGRPLIGDDLDTLIVLWLLCDHADVADDLDLPALLTTLDDLGLRHDRALAPMLAGAESALAHNATRSTDAEHATLAA